MSLKGKRIIIIGGGSGIGAATALAAAKEGATVHVAGRTAASLERVRDRAEGEGRIEPCVLDATNERAVGECLGRIRGVDHLVYAAAQVQAAPFMELEIEEARGMFESKFWGQFLCVQQVVPNLNADASITLLSGMAAHKPVRGLSMIAAINGAVEALARSLAVELAPVRVNAVCPGFVDTRGLDEQQREAIARGLPVRRVGCAEDVAQGILFLMQNAYATGTTLRLDGGTSVV